MRRTGFVAISAFLTVAPLLVSGIATQWSSGTRYPVGDHAGIELYTREALAGRQLVGAPSRLGFHHPGPAFFYAAAPLYWARGERYIGIQATAGLLGVAGMLAMLGCAFRGGGAMATWAAALPLSVICWARGAQALLSSWNPNVATLAFGACLFALARLAAGAPRALPLAVAAGSLAIQSHLGCAPTLIALGALATAFFAWPALRERSGLPPAEPTGPGELVASVILGAVLWALPAVDALAPGHGNLGALAEFVAESHESHSLGEAAAAVARQFAAFAAESWAVPAAAGLALAALWAVPAARRRGAHTTQALSSLCVAGAALATLSATHAAGPLYPYLIRWVSMLGVGAGAAALHVGLLVASERWRPEPRTRRTLERAALVALAALALLSSWGAAPEDPDDENRPGEQSARVARMADSLQARLREYGIRRPLVVVPDPSARGLAIAVLLELDKRSVAFAVRPFSVIRFPPTWRPRGEDAILLFRWGRRGSEPKDEVLVRDGPYRVESRRSLLNGR